MSECAFCDSNVGERVTAWIDHSTCRTCGFESDKYIEFPGVYAWDILDAGVLKHVVKPDRPFACPRCNTVILGVNYVCQRPRGMGGLLAEGLFSLTNFEPIKIIDGESLWTQKK